MAADTKEKIWRGAAELFRERGYAGVSMRDIADRAGIRVGNLTYYYPKKEDLVEAMYLEAAEEMYQNVVFRSVDDVVEYARSILAIQRRNAFLFDSFDQIAESSERMRKVQIGSIERLGGIFAAGLRELAIFGKIPMPRSRQELDDRVVVLLQVLLTRLPGEERRLTGAKSDEAVLRRIRLLIGEK